MIFAAQNIIITFQYRNSYNTFTACVQVTWLSSSAKKHEPKIALKEATLVTGVSHMTYVQQLNTHILIAINTITYLFL